MEHPISSPNVLNGSFKPTSSRRHACDRCRNHKLRCNRDVAASVSDPCHRCIKAKAKCTMIGSSKPGISSERNDGLKETDEILRAEHGTLNDGWVSQINNNDITQLGQNNTALFVPSSDLEMMDFDSVSSTFGFNNTNLEPNNLSSEHIGSTLPNDAFSLWDGTDNLVLLNQEQESIRNQVPSDEYLRFGLNPTKDASTNVASTSPTLSAGFSLESRKELCIQKLTCLSASLMKNLTRLDTCTAATSFIFTRSDQNTADYLFRTIDGSSPQNHAFGNAMRSTEEFLGIINEYKRFRTHVGPSMPFHPQESCVGGDNPTTIAFEAAQGMNTEEERLQRFQVLLSYRDERKDPNQPYHVSGSSSSSSSPKPIPLPVPFGLTILTCYTCILKSFESIFLSLLRWLSVPESSPLRVQLAEVTAGVQVNGFTLDSFHQRTLQFKIMIQVCQDMTDRMETTIWSNHGDGTGGPGILADPVFQGLLQVLLAKDGLKSQSGDNDTSGLGNLRKLMLEIEMALK